MPNNRTLAVGWFDNKPFQEICSPYLDRIREIFFAWPGVLLCRPAPEKIIAAYATRSYDGNLAELMDAPHVFPKSFDNKSFDAAGELWTRVRECPHANDCTHCGLCGDLMKEVFK